MKKYLIIFILIFGFSLPMIHVFAYTTGFIPGQIWYSNSSPKEGENINIYTVVWNGRDSMLKTKVEFYDKNVILGSRDVTILANQSKEVSISWKATSGNHVISAKITSSSITSDGKKEIITSDNSQTEENKLFVPVTISKANGETATSSDLIKNELNKAGSKMEDVVPEVIYTPVTNVLDKVDIFRDETAIKIDEVKDQTEKEIDSIKAEKAKNDTSKIKINEKVSVENAVENPITYLKFFFLSILSFIFNTEIVFYGIFVVVIFLLLRFIYRKIRNR